MSAGGGAWRSGAARSAAWGGRLAMSLLCPDDSTHLHRHHIHLHRHAAPHESLGGTPPRVCWCHTPQPPYAPALRLQIATASWRSLPPPATSRSRSSARIHGESSVGAGGWEGGLPNEAPGCTLDARHQSRSRTPQTASRSGRGRAARQVFPLSFPCRPSQSPPVEECRGHPGATLSRWTQPPCWTRSVCTCWPAVRCVAAYSGPPATTTPTCGCGRPSCPLPAPSVCTSRAPASTRAAWQPGATALH